MKRIPLTSSLTPIVICILISIAGFIFYIQTTEEGLWLTDDSILFVIGADSIIDGNGFSRISGSGEVKPLTGFPPGYSSILAIARFIGIDIYSFARWMNGLFYLGSVFLAGWLVHRITASTIASVICLLLIITSRSFLSLHGWLMAEASFIFLIILGLVALLLYVERKRRKLLIAAAILIGLSVMSRYTGLALIPAFCLFLVFSSVKPWKRRVEDALIFGFLASLPFIALALTNQAAAGSMVNREVSLLSLDLPVIATYIEEMFSWILPWNFIASIRLRYKILSVVLLFVILPGIPVVTQYRNDKRAQSNRKSARLLSLFPLIIVTYLLLIWYGISSLNPSRLHIQRYLEPIFILCTISIPSTLAIFITRKKAWASLQILSLVFAGFIIAASGYELYQTLVHFTPQLSEYQRDELNATISNNIRSVGDDDPFITNEIYFVYFLINESTYQVPIYYNSYKDEVRADFERQLDVYWAMMSNGSYLILFDSIDQQQPRFPPREILTDGLTEVRSFEGGAIYSSK